MKTVLTIAGTDPSGAAGIQVDLQTFRDHGCHGASVITAVLAQNTQGVREVAPLSPDLVDAQLQAVFDDFDVAAVKVGLVPNDEVIELLAERLAGRVVVWDPVLASGDGRTPLFAGTAARLVRAVTGATIVTPNIPELSVLSGAAVETREDAHRAATAMSSRGAAVLVKVGHLDHTGMLEDIWSMHGESCDLDALPAISADVRGTGCQLSSAVACNLALDQEPVMAVENARSYLNDLLTNQALQLGRGRPLVVRALPHE